MPTRNAPEYDEGRSFEEYAVYVAVALAVAAYGLKLLGAHVPFFDDLLTKPTGGHVLQIVLVASLGLLTQRMYKLVSQLRGEVYRLCSGLDERLPEIARDVRISMTRHFDDLLLQVENAVNADLGAVCPAVVHETLSNAGDLAKAGAVNIHPAHLPRYYQALLQRFPGDHFLAVASAKEDVWSLAGIYDFMDTFINKAAPRGTIQRVFIVGHADALTQDELDLLRRHKKLGVDVKAVSAEMTSASDADTLFLVHEGNRIALTASVRDSHIDQVRVTTDREEVRALHAHFHQLYAMALVPALDPAA